MEDYTIGQWIEWLDSRRDSEYSDEGDGVYHSWKIETDMALGPYLPSKFLHEYIDWPVGKWGFKSSLGNVVRSRTAWRKYRLTKVKPKDDWEESVCWILNNLL